MQYHLKNVIDWLRNGKADYSDCRFVCRDNETIQVTGASVDNVARTNVTGVGIRVLANGCWGFAASNRLTVSELKATASRALQIARASAVTRRERVHLAEQQAYEDHYASDYEIDPFAVSIDDKLQVLFGINEVLMKSPKIKAAVGNMDFYRTKKLFVSSEGACIEQEIVESGVGFHVVASNGRASAKRSYGGSLRGNFAASGYEFITGQSLLREADRIREEAIELLTAKPCPHRKTTVILSGHMVAMQVHESCGHPSELDRVLGTEISLAGGSFMTLDKQGKFRYGSDIVNITADATHPGGLGTFGYDDEGVKAQRTPLVKDGILCGYLTSRETAPVIRKRSNGTMRADGPFRMPLIRMTNINLEPGDVSLDNLIADTKTGIFIGLNSGVSIDDQRLNFQFTGECAWEIKNGRLGQMYRDPIYSGITPQVWGKCDAICSKDHWVMYGVLNCGKGVPMQGMHVGHGAAPARFRNIQVGVKK